MYIHICYIQVYIPRVCVYTNIYIYMYKRKVCGHALEVSQGPAPNAANQTKDIRESARPCRFRTANKIATMSVGTKSHVSMPSQYYIYIYIYM